jgi:hypothetical protein
MKTDIKKMIAGKTKLALTSNILAADAIKQNITTVPELKNLIPTPSDEEISQLELNILQHGCQTPLQLWQVAKSEFYPDTATTNEILYVLIDGHNRYQICKKHNLAFEVYILSFKDLKEAKDYMINLQLGRRNLSPSQISYFRGLKYNNEKANKEDNLKASPSKGQNDPSVKSTAERLGIEYKVSPKTIKRDADFAKGLDLLSTSLKQEVLAGNVKIDKNLIQKIGKSDEQVSNIDSLEVLNDLLRSEIKKPVLENIKDDFSIENHAKMILEISQKFSESQSIKDLENLIIVANQALQSLRSH